MQWLQDPNKGNEHNLNNVRREATRHFRNKKKEYLKTKIGELETNSKFKNIIDIYGCNKYFKRVTSLELIQQGMRWVILLETATVFWLVRWRKSFSQLFNVHGVKDVRQTYIHTTEPQAPEPSAFDVEMALEKLKRHKSPGIDQIPAESIKAAGRTIRSEIHKLINSIWNKEELHEEWKKSIILPIYMKGDKTDCSNYGG